MACRDQAYGSLAEAATLDAGLAQQLAVLLLGHALAPLLDDRSHGDSSWSCVAGARGAVGSATARQRAPGERATDVREEAEVRASEADRDERMCGEDAEARASESDQMCGEDVTACASEGDQGAWGPVDADLITSYEEKPKVPKGHLAVPPFYFYRREDVKRIPEALAAGCGADAPGSFAAWLSRQVPMHAFVMPGKRYDVGDVESYRSVCRVFEGM